MRIRYNVSMRKKNITKEMICETAISLAAESGLENFTTKKVALRMGISEGTIFNNYPNKGALLTDCLYSIDREIDEVLKGVHFRLTAFSSYVHDLWYAYFRYLIANRDKAKFYLYFRHSAYYTAEVIKGQEQSFAFFSWFLKHHVSFFKVKPDIFWVFIIETTMNFAVKGSEGDIEVSDTDIDSIYNLLMHGITGIFKKKADDDDSSN